MNNILFIVEGKVDEVKILGNEAKGLLSIVGINADIISVENPIYELYDFLKNDSYQDIVAYLKQKKKIKIERSKGAFSSIYLVFDFEHHYQKYSDEKIIEMLRFFDNETENGKLYLNYPMLEAFYHIKSIPDNEYNNRKVDIDLISSSGKQYKKLVNRETCLNRKYVTKEQYLEIVKSNFNKVNYILNDATTDIDYLKLLRYELDCVNKKQYVDVLSTFPLFLVDSYFDKIIDFM